MVNPTSRWQADDYSSTGAFVADLAGEILESLNPQPGERILDVGCGDGRLSQRIAATGARVFGVDASPDLVAQARAAGLEVLHADAAAMPFEAEFDAVFSNAALHWMLDPPAVAVRMFTALRPGGRLAVEFGGFGNIAAIRTALSCVLHRRGIDVATARDQYYPTVAEYCDVLSAAGFSDVEAVLVPRPTRLEHGMVAWLQTFRSGLLEVLGVSPAGRDEIFAETARVLAPALQDVHGTWWADYVRIRAWARKPL